MFCIKCGTENPDQAKFCFKCGSNLFDVNRNAKINFEIADKRLKHTENTIDKTKHGLKKFISKISSKLDDVTNFGKNFNNQRQLYKTYYIRIIFGIFVAIIFLILFNGIFAYLIAFTGIILILESVYKLITMKNI